jgi:ABC-type multidrug transport system ATPase subunit
MSTYRLEEIRIRRGRHRILDGVSAELSRGDVAMLVGANGTGKTTLLECLVGRLPVESGRCLRDGVAVDFVSEEWRSTLAYCPASEGTVPFLTVEEHLAMATTLAGALSRPGRAGTQEPLESGFRDRAEQLSEIWGLGGHLSHRAAELSDGLRKRLSLALMLISPSELYFLDEPTLSLDAEGVALLGQLLRAIRTSGSAALVTTHTPELFDECTTSRWNLLAGANGSAIESVETTANEQTTPTHPVARDRPNNTPERFAWLFL